MQQKNGLQMFFFLLTFAASTKKDKQSNKKYFALWANCAHLIKYTVPSLGLVWVCLQPSRCSRNF